MMKGQTGRMQLTITAVAARASSVIHPSQAKWSFLRCHKVILPS
jgi:hypothetical protein